MLFVVEPLEAEVTGPDVVQLLPQPPEPTTVHNWGLTRLPDEAVFPVLFVVKVVELATVIVYVPL